MASSSQNCPSLSIQCQSCSALLDSGEFTKPYARKYGVCCPQCGNLSFCGRWAVVTSPSRAVQLKPSPASLLPKLLGPTTVVGDGNATHDGQSPASDKNDEKNKTPSRAPLHFNQGCEHFDCGDFSMAEECFSRALLIFEKELGSDAEDTLDAAANLGVTYRKLGDFKRATAHLKRVVDGREKAHGLDHPKTLASYVNIANLYDDKNQKSLAADFYKQASLGMKKLYGESDPRTLTVASNMTSLAYDGGQKRQSIKKYELYFQMKETLIGKNNLSTLTTLDNLACAYLKSNEVDALNIAEKHFQRVLEGLTVNLGRYHPETIETLENMAILYAKKADTKKASDYKGRAAEAYLQVYGPDHPKTVAAKHWAEKWGYVTKLECELGELDHTDNTIATLSPRLDFLNPNLK